MNLLGPHISRPADCERVLRSLPAWFGIEDALMRYAQDTAHLPTFAYERDGVLAAFITLQEHFPAAWEIHCIAVDAAHRNDGVGSTLLSHAQAWLKTQGARFLQVKTIAETSASVEYTQTRAFYFARGFTPLEEFPDLWSPKNPALQLIKVLT